MAADSARPGDNEASPKERSLVRGVVAAAASTVATVLLVSLLLGEAFTDSALGMTFGAVFVFVWALVVAVLIGLPIHFALRRLGRNGVGPYLAAGVVGSLTPELVEVGSSFLIPCGLVAGAVFWAASVRGK